MRILLVDADSHNGYPNLAIMKISAWYKIQGDHVTLIKGIPTTAPLLEYDNVHISCIFFQNRDRVEDYAKQFKKVLIGGSGWDLETKLSNEVEHIMPDYSLYDTDFSMGFTSRGCIRKCGFCIVPEKEGTICDNADITEFHHPDHKKIMLLDNNFLASPQWKNNIDYIVLNDLKVNFNQGLDIRVLTKEMAHYLKECRYYSWNFKTRGLHFAFDDPRYEKDVLKGMNLLENASIPPKHCMFYILVGFNTSFEQDLKRINMIIDAGAVPYIMRYNQTKDKKLSHLARYINRKYYEFVDIEEYMGGVLCK